MAEEAKKRKRVVKNPETFRERAQKANEGTSKPKVTKVTHKAKSGLGRLLSKVFGPIWRLLKFIFNRKPFTYLAKPLSWMGKILVPVYVRNSWKELKLVTWPTWQQSRQLTFAVLAFALVFGLAIAGLDYVLDKLFRQILLK